MDASDFVGTLSSGLSHPAIRYSLYLGANVLYVGWNAYTNNTRKWSDGKLVGVLSVNTLLSVLEGICASENNLLYDNRLIDVTLFALPTVGQYFAHVAGSKQARVMSQLIQQENLQKKESLKIKKSIPLELSLGP